MNQNQIRQILKKKDTRKIDSYIMKNIKRKQEETDLMNLLQTWLHCLLYYKQAYPHEAFAERRIFGVIVYTASANALKTYLNQFFEKLKPQISHINHLKVLIYSEEGGQLIQTNTLHIQDFSTSKMLQQQIEDQRPLNTFQTQMQIKKFLHDLKQKMENDVIHKRQTKTTFKLRVGYRLEQSNKKIENFLLENWLKKQKEAENGEIVLSLKSQELNLIYEQRSS